MPVHPNFIPDYLYFVTTTAVEHMHLFHNDAVKRIIVDSLHFLRTNGRMDLYAFVINHIHFIARFSEKHTLSDVMRDFKQYTARQMIRHLKARDDAKILGVLSSVDKDPRQEYKIWEDSYDARDIFSSDFLQQKMDYMHYNPCQPQWNLVGLPEEYVWSSSSFYLADKPVIIPIDDVRELFI